MYYVITRSGVKSGKNLKVLNKIMGVKLDPNEFVVKGPDFVVVLDNDLQSGDLSDMEFIQDKAKMESLCFAGFFKKDNSGKLLSMLNLIFTFIVMTMIRTIIKALGG